jgi:hypothetical protein
VTQLILCSRDNFHMSNVTRKVNVLQEEATMKLVVIGRSSCTKHVRSLNLVIATFFAACSLYAGLDPCKCPTWRCWHFAICSAQRPLSRPEAFHTTTCAVSLAGRRFAGQLLTARRRCRVPSNSGIYLKGIPTI